jgi:serine/threonine protein kinase
MGGSTLPLALDAFSGRKLGKYEVLCRLSTGGMAEIFLASQRGLAGFRKLVVLKQILPDIAGEEEFVQMFLDEAKVTAAFNHPHIAQVFDLDVADGELFLAMEFVPGATLVEVAKACRAANEPIPVGFSLEAVRDTALALHYAHTFTDPLGRPTSVIHRDVAEKNIMVTYEGVTKLLDFGIAKNLARRGRTQVGMVKGTNGYMSPEQILGEPLDARSDLFSLGVVLHELLTGLRLFHAKTPEAGAGAILHGQVPPPSRSNKAIPPELDAVVLKALARKREDRYASTLEFARALERAVGPLFWHPEQSAELIQRLFAERREQARQLLLTVRSMSGEVSGIVNVAQFLPPAMAPKLAPEPGTLPSLPQITPPLPPRASLSEMPAVKPPPPPPQEAAPQPPPASTPPPTPPRGAATRRATNVAMPALPPADPAAFRRAVFEPLPQKRGGAGQPNEAMPPPPPQENTARTQPGEEEPSYTTNTSWPTNPSTQETTGRTDPGGEHSRPASPAWMSPPPAQETTSRTDPGEERHYPGAASTADENVTRTAPPEEPSHEEAEEEDSAHREVLTQRQELPQEEPPRADRTRPARADLHLMGTIPSTPRAEVRTTRERMPLQEEPAWEEPAQEESAHEEQAHEEPAYEEQAHEESAHEEPHEDDRTRPIRANLHLIATIPSMGGLSRPQSPPAEQEPQEQEEGNPRHAKTTISRVRPALNDRPPVRASNPNFRALPRRAPPPPEMQEEPPTRLDFNTEPSHGPALGEDHVEDTSETPLPHIETDFEEGTLVNAPAAFARPPKREGGGMLLVVLALGVLLVGILGTVVALGLDGGRLMALVSSPSPAGNPGRQEPAPAPAHPQKAAPAAAAPSEPAPSSPAAPEGSAETSPDAQAAPSTPPDAKTEGTAPPAEESAAVPPNGESTDANVEDAVLGTMPPQPTKKNRTSARSASSSAASGTGVLTLVTEPYAKVYLGRRSLGETPLFKISLPAGKHSLRLVREDGRTLRLPVEIKPGETTGLNLKLDEISQP